MKSEGDGEGRGECGGGALSVRAKEVSAEDVDINHLIALHCTFRAVITRCFRVYITGYQQTCM